jgi:hypothetical protein
MLYGDTGHEHDTLLEVPVGVGYASWCWSSWELLKAQDVEW